MLIIVKKTSCSEEQYHKLNSMKQHIFIRKWSARVYL